MSRRTPLLYILALLALLPTATKAQTDPTTARGFEADKLYQFGELDHVGIFNGNLVVTIPIGPTYPVGGTLSYQLVLTHNANLWDFEHSCDQGDPGARCFTFAEPAGGFNAGAGWNLTLGRLLPPGTDINDGGWRYEGPDGGAHGFFNALHQGEATDPQTFYTRDGSYLRMKVENSTQRRIELGDGRYQLFEEPEPGAREWRLTEYGDAFGNTVTITYQTNFWDITDSHGREHRVTFVNTGDETFPQRLSLVKLAAFDSETQAEYSFSYHEADLRRSCPHNDPTDHPLPVHLLDSVTLPTGTSFDFTYYEPGGDGCSDVSGRLASMTLPTLGKIEWTYQSWNFPLRESDDHDITNPTPPRAPATTGVHERILKDRDGSELGRWTYEQQLTTLGTLSFPNVSQTTVTDPLGHFTRHYFSVHRDTVDEGDWSVRDYGLPFTRATTLATTDPWTAQPVELFLSSETFDAADETTPLRRTWVKYQRDHGDPLSFTMEYSSETNRREVARRVEFVDDATYVETHRRDFDGLGHFREAHRQGNYQGDEGRLTLTNFNPTRGAYDVADDGTVSGDFIPLAPAEPWILGTYDVTLQQQDFQAESTEDGTPEPIEPYEIPPGLPIDFEGGPVAAWVEYQFDTTTGFLECRRRTWSSATTLTRDGRDVLEVFTHDGAGNVSSIASYGGDLQSGLGNSSICGTLPAEPEYEERQVWTAGSLSRRSFWERCGTAETELLLTLDQNIDTNTGLVSASRTPGGLETTYSFDELNRLTAVEPAEEAGTFYEYVDATATTAARVEIERRTSAGSTTALTEEAFLFDGQGRVCRQKRRMADGTWSRIDTAYHGNGTRHRVSELHAGSGTTCPTTFTGVAHTEYQDYDPFGRVGRIVPPDGAAHAVDFSYFGERQVKRTVRVATESDGSETAQDTVERYDPHGRLRVVEQTVDGVAQQTKYAYSVENLLRKVTAGNQRRVFNYDRRGFLKNERHPELVDDPTTDAPEDGLITYSFYDSRGNVGRREDRVHVLDTVYDRAGRRTQVKEGSELLEEYFYVPWFDGTTDDEAGKLREARRHHRGALPTETEADLVVSERYTYGGVEGRVSKRQTRMSNRGKVVLFDQFFGYTALGDLLTQTYPNCLHPPCSTTSGAPSRTVANQYSRGFLTGINNWATLTYHPNGAIATVTHENGAGNGAGVTDSYGLDPNNLPRPASIAFAGPSVTWSLGNYAYDGAGNVKAIGSDTFVYDELSRLESATLASAANQSQSYTYDRHSNLTSITTNSSTTNIAVDSRTNRLTATGTSYDSAGNLTAQTLDGQAQSYTWHPLGSLQFLVTPEITKGYLYTPSGQRLVEFDWSEGWKETWSLRDLEGQVVRQWRNTVDGDDSWTWQKDYIRRGGQLLASITPDEERHYHLDHLGTPRLVTSDLGLEQARHTYFPYGQEATDPTQTTEPMRFTGHERDANGTGSADDLDYMKARYCSPNQGRFLSVDKVLGKPPNPQSWNRYLYAQGNPVKFVDPDGNEALAAIRLEQDIQAVLAGDMSREEFRERNQARASGAALGVSLVLPGPEDLALGYAATSRIGSAILGRAGGFLKRVFRGRDPDLKNLARARTAEGKLARVAESLGKTADEVLDIAQKQGKRVIDNRNQGRVNLFVQIDGKVVRITMDPQQEVIISVGRERLSNILKRIDNGKFEEIDEILPP